jgi:hypothetical protein
MGYAVAFTPKAAEEFSRLPIDLAMVVDAQIEALASDPISRSGKPYFPYRPGGLMSEFKHDFADRTCYVKVFFHFGARESSIVITGFVFQTIMH